MIPRRLACLLGVVTAGCASTKTFGPDRREVHTLNCSGGARSWSMCLERAGELCGPRGYDVLERGGGTAGYLIPGGSATPLIGREMMIAWRAPQ